VAVPVAVVVDRTTSTRTAVCIGKVPILVKGQTGVNNMQEKSKRSEELRDRIIKDEKLLRDLSETISGILKGRVKLEEDETYAFVPLVYKNLHFCIGFRRLH